MSDDAPIINRRTFRRAKAPILSRPAGLVGEIPRLVNDISSGGLRTYSDEQQKIGSRLEIELFFPDASSAIITVEVVWVEELPAGSPAKFDLGLRYLNAHPEDLERIGSVLVAE